VRAASTLTERMQQDGIDTVATLAAAAKHLTDLTSDVDSADPSNIAQFVSEAQEASNVDGGIPGIPAPWASLNEITTGWKPGQLIVTAAATGVGKSAFASAIAAHNLEAGVLLFSLEMLGREIAARMICTRAGVDSRRYDLGKLTPYEREQCDHEAGRLQGNFWIDDSASLDVATMRSKALRWVSKHNVSLVIVDYLGLVDEKIEGANRANVVGAISRGLKMLAMEARVPVMALHQLNRDSAKEKREPQLHDLRDSGNVEQDANQVILLHRMEQGDGIDKIKVRVAKNRGGPLSSIVLNFRRSCTRFEEVAHVQDRSMAQDQDERGRNGDSDAGRGGRATGDASNSRVGKPDVGERVRDAGFSPDMGRRDLA
jgi:replicative DNA helicase